MKKLLLLFCAVLALSCSDDAGNSIMEQSIFVDSSMFIPTAFKVNNGTSNPPGESSLVFSLTKGAPNTSGYEAIIFSVAYPMASSSAPNGTYTFGIGETETTLFANGSYVKGTTAYSLAGNTVKVTKFPSNVYRLEFENIEAVSMPAGTVKVISGYCEGNFE